MTPSRDTCRGRAWAWGRRRFLYSLLILTLAPPDVTAAGETSTTPALSAERARASQIPPSRSAAGTQHVRVYQDSESWDAFLVNMEIGDAGPDGQAYHYLIAYGGCGDDFIDYVLELWWLGPRLQPGEYSGFGREFDGCPAAGEGQYDGEAAISIREVRNDDILVGRFSFLGRSDSGSTAAVGGFLGPVPSCDGSPVRLTGRKLWATSSPAQLNVTLHARFEVTGDFSSVESPACCEYRQYVRDRSAFVINGFDVVRFPGYGLRWGEWQEDGVPVFDGDPCPRPYLRYGHRDDAPNCTGDSYAPGPRLTGTLYRGKDHPSRNVQPSPTMYAFRWRLDFEARRAFVPRQEFGCTGPATETTEDSWSFCLGLVPGGLERCEVAPAQEREAEIIGEQFVEIGSPGSRRTVSFVFQNASDFVAVVVVADGPENTTSDRELETEAGGIRLSLSGFEPRELDVPVSSTTTGRAWSRLFAFERPAHLPSSTYVVLSGLQASVEFEQPLAWPAVKHAPILTSKVTPTVRVARVNAAGNPSKDGVGLVCMVPTAGPCQLQVYSVAGRVVATVFDGELEPGEHAIAWDGRDSQGVRLGRGVYVVRLRGRHFHDTTKVVLLD